MCAVATPAKFRLQNRHQVLSGFPRVRFHNRLCFWLTRWHHDEGQFVPTVFCHRLFWSLDLGNVKDGMSHWERLVFLLSGVRIDFFLLNPSNDTCRFLARLDHAIQLVPRFEGSPIGTAVVSLHGGSPEDKDVNAL